MEDWQHDLTPPREGDREGGGRRVAKKTSFPSMVHAGTAMTLTSSGQVRPAIFGDSIIGHALEDADETGMVRIKLREL